MKALITLMLVLLLAGPAGAADLVLSPEFAVRDAVDGANFAPLRSTVTALGRLSIGMEAGTNPYTWQSRAFRASTDGAKRTAADVLVVRITAPQGLLIGVISYEQTVTKAISRQGSVTSALTVTINGVPQVVPSNLFSVDLSAERLREAEVVIAPTLAAFLPAGGLGSGTIEITGAELAVEYVQP